MAGSDQKTQIATELPPEVAAALGGRPAAAKVLPPAPNITGARTVIAEAPQLPSVPAVGGAVPASGPDDAAAARLCCPCTAAGFARRCRRAHGDCAALTLPSPGPAGAMAVWDRLAGRDGVFDAGSGPAGTAGGCKRRCRPPMRPQRVHRRSCGPPAWCSLVVPSAGMPPTARWVIGTDNHDRHGAYYRGGCQSHLAAGPGERGPELPGCHPQGNNPHRAARRGRSRSTARGDRKGPNEVGSKARSARPPWSGSPSAATSPTKAGCSLPRTRGRRCGSSCLPGEKQAKVVDPTVFDPRQA